MVLTSWYEVLGVTTEASDRDIRTAYRIRALLHHPDKGGDPEVFEEVQRAYECLSDPEQRQLYDLTGATGDQGSYLTWTPVTPELIEVFQAEYRYSEQERDDVLEYYREHEGDMSLILSYLMCSQPDDTPRLLKIIEGALKSKELKKLKKWTSETRALARKNGEKLEKSEKRRKRAEKKASKEGTVKRSLAEQLVIGRHKQALRQSQMMDRWAKLTEVDNPVNWSDIEDEEEEPVRKRSKKTPSRNR